MSGIAANMYGRKIQLIFYCRDPVTRHYFNFYFNEFVIGHSIEICRLLLLEIFDLEIAKDQSLPIFFCHIIIDLLLLIFE
jgi:hypothetical protein